MPIICATTIDGKWIEAARWSVGSIADLREGNDFQLVLPVKDEALTAYLAKNQRPEVQLERADGKPQVTIGLKVVRIRHLLEPPDDLQSMVLLVPVNRAAESVLMYLLDLPACNPKFVAMIRGKEA